MIIRQYHAFQPFISSVKNLESASPGGSIWDEASWQNLFQSRKIFVSLEFQKELLLGYAALSWVEREAELLKIAVSPEYRRQGIGRRLLYRIIRELPPQQTDVLHLEVRSDNPAAISFYERLGFEAVGQRTAYYSEPVCDAILYSLSLAVE